MPYFKAKRDCNPGGIYYREGQTASFAKNPDPELFVPADGEGAESFVPAPANPGGKKLAAAERDAIMAANRPRKAARS